MTKPQLILADKQMLPGVIQEGEKHAFAEIYRQHGAAVARRLAFLLGTAEPVQDLTQETFLRAYQSLNLLRKEASLIQWLLKIALNVSRDHYRRHKRSLWRLWRSSEEEQFQQNEGQCSVDSSERLADLSAVHSALARLSPRLREAVILFELEGLNLSEVAAALDISPNTAASRIRRGREKLRQQLSRAGYFTHGEETK